MGAGSKMIKIKLLLSVITIIFLLSGCKYEVNITDEESEQFSEYMAYFVLNKDPNYKTKLITATPIPEATKAAIPTDAAIAEPTKEPDNLPGSNQSSVVGNIKSNEDFTELLGYKGLSIEYDSYEITDSFNDGLTFLNSGTTDSYLIVYYTVKNNSADIINVDFGGNGITYQLNVNSGISLRANLTTLTNDIRFLKTDIEAGSTYKAVVVFSVSKSTVINTLDIVVLKGKNSMIYKLM